jgi:hypothetical protein
VFVHPITTGVRRAASEANRLQTKRSDFNQACALVSIPSRLSKDVLNSQCHRE